MQTWSRRRNPISADNENKPLTLRISVVGLGYVGSVACASLARIGHKVLAFDRDPFRNAAMTAGRSPVAEPGLAEVLGRETAAGRIIAASDVRLAVAETDMTFVTVGTPANDDRSISLDEVEAAIEDVGRGIYAKSSPHVVVLRSTVPPGVSQEVVIPLLERFSRRRLGDGLEYHFHPEFLRTGSALNDVEAPPLIVIGERGGGSAVLLRNLYHASSVPINVTSYKTAEAVKLLSNVFHAVKITFANEAGAALAEVGVDAREAFDLLCADTSLNISPSYLGPGFAFGGPCLPKDLAAFVQLAEGLGVAVPFLASLPAANKTVASRALELIDPQPGRSIVLFGLAFKPGTADVRDSPYATLALELVAKGCKLRIIDSLVRLAWAARPESPPEDYRCLAGLIAEDIVSEVADAETVVLGHVSPQDLYLLNQNLDGKFVVDLAPNPQLTLRRGPNYRGLCW